MKKTKNAKRAFLSSIIATVLCISMLIGTTYAWFTDSATSGGNIIKSGILNIDLGIKTKADSDYVSVKENPTKKAINYDKWEPGYTEWVNAKVYTTGNLALKYTMKLVAEGTVTDLADVIDLYYKPAEVALPATRPADLEAAGLVKIGTLAEAISGSITINDVLIPVADDPADVNTADFATIALHMQESAGNEYQNKEIGASFAFQILATQYTYEEDSFDDQYDANADFVDLPVASISSMPATNAGNNGELTTYFTNITVPADAAFKFVSNDTLADIAGTAYERWAVDFVVSFNQDVDGGNVYLFGQYDAFSADWLGEKLLIDGGNVPAGTKTKLIADWLNSEFPSVTVDYKDVVTLGTFNSAIHVENPAPGLVVTVDLIMTDADGIDHVISTIPYSFD